MPEITHHEDEPNLEIHHESSDVNVRGVLWFFVIFFVVTLVSFAGLWGLYKYYAYSEREAQAPPMSRLPEASNQTPPAPNLQTDPPRDMALFRAEETKQLDQAGWVDRKNGIVRIPIEEAMKEVVQRGLPVRQQPQSSTATAGAAAGAGSASAPPVAGAPSGTGRPMEKSSQ
ncbi:MAG: hypothetical protein WBX15_00430 [Thermoanaerobaculia bacterium]